jgi:hypothetical protein
MVQQQLAGAPSTALRYLKAAGDSRRHQLRVPQRGQIDEGYAVVIGLGQVTGRGQRQVGFADPAVGTPNRSAVLPV